MKVGFIGCVHSSEKALKTLLAMKPNGIETVAVITKTKSQINADYVDLRPLCEKNNIPCFCVDETNQITSVEFMKNFRPDVIYCIGWSHLLKKDMLNVAPKGVIGFHPTMLPRNRGRHPIIWALALGLDSTGSSFFRMSEGADSGPLVHQVEIPIRIYDDANNLYERILSVLEDQIKEITIAFASNTEKLEEQDESQATYWRKRTSQDGKIDWRMEATAIYNLIRALTKPYPGAELLLAGDACKVWRSRIHDAASPNDIEPGFVLQVDNSAFLIKCAGSSSIWITEHDLPVVPKVGDYL